MTTWKRNPDTGKMEIISIDPEIIELEAEEVPNDEFLNWSQTGVSYKDFLKSSLEDSRRYRQMLMKAYGLKEEDLADPKDFKNSIQESNEKIQAKFNNINRRKPKQDFSWEELEELTNLNEEDL